MSFIMVESGRSGSGNQGVCGWVWTWGTLIFKGWQRGVDQRGYKPLGNSVSEVKERSIFKERYIISKAAVKQD